MILKTKVLPRNEGNLRRVFRVFQREGEDNGSKNVRTMISTYIDWMWMKFEVSGSRGRLKQTWKKQVENEIKRNGFGETVRR